MSHGITFGETMAGPFALGETRSEGGRDKGKQEGTGLKMDAVAAIPDPHALTAEPDHPGGPPGTG